MKSRLTTQAGFTLIEAMAATSIVILLLSSIAPAVGAFSAKAKLANAKMNAHIVQSVIEGYASEHAGEYPTARSQYVSSPTYKKLTNPFRPGRINDGIGTWNNPEGASKDDDPTPDAPISIWNIDPQNVALPNTVGAVLYVPFRNESLAKQSRDSGTLNGLPLGGDSGSHGYTAYTIMALGTYSFSNVNDLITSMSGGKTGTDLGLPYRDSRITNW